MKTLVKDKQFMAYFNNKIMVCLWMVQRPAKPDTAQKALRAAHFFEDLYHHWLDLPDQKDLSAHLEWLIEFFLVFPEVSEAARDRAQTSISIVHLRLTEGTPC